MNARTNRWIIAAAFGCLIVGSILSRAIETGVRVEKIMLTTNTPALRLFPSATGPHPVALLAHGAGGSKEMLFRFGEAFAAAGFDCYSIDLAGFGESPRPCSLTNLDVYFPEAFRALGAVDVFVGHSLGGGVGNWSVLNAGFRPRLFIGMGAPVELGVHGPPLLLLGGLFEELHRPATLRARTDAQVVISPWSDHILEAYDPALARAAVKAACAAVGKPVPAAPTAWRWRFTGLVLGIAAAFVLMYRLPQALPSLARFRGIIAPSILLLALGLTLGTWVGVTPNLRRIPLQLVLLLVLWGALAGLSRLRLPRWSLAVATAILALGFLALQIAYSTDKSSFLPAMLMSTFAISTLLLLPSTLVGRIASRGGSRHEGDIAMAIFASYAIGQFMPLFY